MANITIRNLPDEVHEQLKARAQANHRSLNQEVVALLMDAGDDQATRIEKGLAEIEKLRTHFQSFLSQEEIAEAKEFGRK